MNLDWLKSKTAWQPLTFRGVAAFADASFARLFLVQFVFAIFVSSTIVLFVQHAWVPVVQKAIHQLPATGEIRGGRLIWDESPTLLGEGRFIAFIADMDHSGAVRVPSHLQVEFGRADVRLISLLGYLDVPYSSRFVVGFNRLEVEPWWGAWSPPILWALFGAGIVVMLLTWWSIAFLYSLPLYFAGLFANRDLSLAGGWKLAGAALMPGALWMTLAVGLYALSALDLVQLLMAQIFHWAIGIFYCIGGSARRPKVLETTVKVKNPFDTNLKPKRAAEQRKPQNPFKTSDD